MLEKTPGMMSSHKALNYLRILQKEITITEKINVKGENIHQLYSWLTDKEKNGNINSNVKWNFQKYLVGRSGELINYFYSTTNPLSNKITSLLND